MMINIKLNGKLDTDFIATFFQVMIKGYVLHGVNFRILENCLFEILKYFFNTDFYAVYLLNSH
jgi:hypothetical protein